MGRCSQDGCSGPHAYGWSGFVPTSKKQTQNFERLDDDQWLTRSPNHGRCPVADGPLSAKNQ